MRTIKSMCLFFILTSIQCVAEESKKPDRSNKLPAWSPGYLDIHHISTGRGNAAYFIFPDGTEMLFDVGDLGVDSLPQYPPLKVAEARPDGTRQPGWWIAEYVKQARPENKPLKVDYAVISHFHTDHYGNAETRTEKSISGGFIRTGLTELGDLIPIAKLIDRAYPDYDSPIDLKKRDDVTFANYLAFIEEKQLTEGLEVEALVTGSNTQIAMQYEAERYPEFSIRNLKSNGTIWSGVDNETFEYLKPKDTVNEEGQFNENPLSLALEVSYGKFDYFTGGDMTGLQGFGLQEWFDVETPIANVVGQVDALTLNHHGNRDATNENFLKALAPRVIVQQSWISDHPGGEVLHRMISESIYPGPRDIFSTSMLHETMVAIGPWMMNAYNSFEGHILIRVMPGGGEYTVHVLDDRSHVLKVKSSYGPYRSN